MFRSLLALLAAAVAVWALTGCTSVPPGRSSVDAVTVRGTKNVPESAVVDGVATTETEKFLGLFRGVIHEYSTFDRFVLQRDLARVEAIYRARGYYDAHARAGRIHEIDDKHVRVEIVVEEGQPVVVRRVRLEGTERAPPELASEVEAVAREGLPQGKPFVEADYTRVRADLRRVFLDHGFAYAEVKSDAAVDVVRHQADVVYTLTPGPKCVLGPIRVEGLGELPEGPVRRAMDLREGMDFSQRELDDAQQQLLDLGVFASVEITAERSEGAQPSRVVPVVVRVAPSRLRTIRLGGGVELDALKTDVHAIVGWEHRNFLGGLRSFRVAFRPGVVLYPIRLNNLVEPEAPLLEERLRVDFKQPGFVEARTDGFVRPEFNVYPVLINPDPPPGARVLGYAELRNAIGVERSFWRLHASISHNVQLAYPFGYLGAKDPTLGPVLISYPAFFTALDFRDDKVHPSRGFYIANTLQLAGLGGDATDVKVQPEVRGYVPLGKRVVLAARVSVGLLAPQDYGSVVRNPPRTFGPATESTTKDYQVTFFRGFVSGGPTSNRGYPIRGVGPYDLVPFLTPDIALAQLDASCSGSATDRCRSPTGGFTLWEASTEARVLIVGPLSAAAFCDASDVSPQVADIRLTHLHLSCGAGGRYDTPVGPVRLDVGYRIPGAQVLGGLTPDEREPTLLFGAPIAVHIGIGEAY